MKRATLMASAALAAIAVGMLTTGAEAQDKQPIKIGVLSTLEGTYTVPGEDGVRGVKLAVKDHGGTVDGHPIDLIVQSTDDTPDTAVRQARKLVEQSGVKLIIGPLSGSEGIALRDYAKTVPNVTIINGISGAQETTFVDPAPNFFRFNMDGAQWGAGLGDYVVNKKGWKYVATVAPDYSFGYTNFLGFAVGFCEAGGHITDRFWVPLGSSDFASIIAAMPDDIDAIYVGMGGGDAVNFLNQYQQAGGHAHLIGGTIMVDQSVLSSKGRAKDALIGTPSSGPQADNWDNPKWKAFVKDYQNAFPPDQRFPIPSLFAVGYYNATDAALQCLAKPGVDLSGDQKAFRQCLSTIKLDAPNGEITLDKNRQAIGTNFITEVVAGKNGNLENKLVKVVPNVNQTLGVPAAEFRKMGIPGRNVPDCDALRAKAKKG